MKLEKIDYQGWRALRLATNSAELIAPTDLGPRVLSLRSRQGGRNVLFEFPREEGGRAGDGYFLRGGHRLWHSPEDSVRTYQPDNDPVKVTPLKNGFILGGAVEARTGMEKTVRIEALGERTFRLTHTLANRGSWTVECAAWPLTMLKRGGYAVVPLPPKGAHPRDLLPTYSLVPWSYTDLALPCWDFHRDFIGIDTARAKKPQKLGLTNYPGWSAYWLAGTTFVKQAPVAAGKPHPDFGCAFETFCNDTLIELETLSPLVPLAPGRSVTHIEHWGVLDGLPKPSTDRAFAAKLRPAVNAWLAKL